MSITQLVTAEMGHVEEVYSQSTTSAIISSANPHKGTYAFRANLAATTGQFQLSQRLAGGTLKSGYLSISLWMYVTTFPNTLGGAFIRFTAAGVAKQRVQFTAGQVGGITLLNDAGTGVATSGAGAMPTGRWFRLDIDCGYNAGAGIRAYIDGALVANSDLATVTLCDAAWFGYNTVSTGSMDFDEIVTYDSSIPSDMIGAQYQIDVLRPISDNNRGGWTDGNGGTTNLFESLNNVPPTGTNSSVNGQKIKNVVASATDNADFNLATYDSAVPVTNVIRAAQLLVNNAQTTTTGSPKAGAVALVSNPSQTEQSFDFGLPNGVSGSVVAAASGTFPVGWGTAWGPVSENPSVTRSSSPVGRVGRRYSGSTQQVNADYMAAHVLSLPTTVGWGLPIGS